MRRVYSRHPERFWVKVDQYTCFGEDCGYQKGLGCCWRWLGSKHGKGYGHYRLDGSITKAHRVSYELLKGPIPDGLQMDHLCRQHTCVNPAHCEAVTSGENTRRGDTIPGRFARATHCKRGHALTPENLYAWAKCRCCKPCQNIREGLRRQRRRERLVAGIVGIMLIFVTGTATIAKNCTGADCSCSDTLVASVTLSGAQEYYCPNVDQALKIAAGVTLNCSGSWVTSNHGVDNAAGFRLLGGVIVNCWVWDGWEIGVKLDGNGSQMWYGGVGGSIAQEGIHASDSTSGHVIYGVFVQAPMEALYFKGSHGSHVEASTFVGAPATYANDGASDNHVLSCDLSGGSNRSIFSAAGSGNWWEGNDYHNGIVRSVNGSAYPNYIGPNPNATIQNTDGSLAVY